MDRGKDGPVPRRCSRTACAGGAVATLTYVYADQTAVLGPLATFAEPHTYDLCAGHAERLSAPRGWAIVRLLGDDDLDPGDPVARAQEDDLLAVADAVREGGRPSRRDRRVGARQGAAPAAEPAGMPPSPTAPDSAGTVEVNRRGHLRVLRDR